MASVGPPRSWQALRMGRSSVPRAGSAEFFRVPHGGTCLVAARRSLRAGPTPRTTIAARNLLSQNPVSLLREAFGKRAARSDSGEVGHLAPAPAPCGPPGKVLQGKNDPLARLGAVGGWCPSGLGHRCLDWWRTRHSLSTCRDYLTAAGASPSCPRTSAVPQLGAPHKSSPRLLTPASLPLGG